MVKKQTIRRKTFKRKTFKRKTFKRKTFNTLRGAGLFATLRGRTSSPEKYEREIAEVNSKYDEIDAKELEEKQKIDKEKKDLEKVYLIFKIFMPAFHDYLAEGVYGMLSGNLSNRSDLTLKRMGDEYAYELEKNGKVTFKIDYDTYTINQANFFRGYRYLLGDSVWNNYGGYTKEFDRAHYPIDFLSWFKMWGWPRYGQFTIQLTSGYSMYEIKQLVEKYEVATKDFKNWSKKLIDDGMIVPNDKFIDLVKLYKDMGSEKELRQKQDDRWERADAMARDSGGTAADYWDQV